MAINVVCVVFGCVGVMCAAVCAVVEGLAAYRRARDAKRRYIKD